MLEIPETASFDEEQLSLEGRLFYGIFKPVVSILVNYDTARRVLTAFGKARMSCGLSRLAPVKAVMK